MNQFSFFNLYIHTYIYAHGSNESENGNGWRLERLQLGSSGGKIKGVGAMLCLGGGLIIALYKGKMLHLITRPIIRHPSITMLKKAPNHWPRGTLFLLFSCFCFGIWYISQVWSSSSSRIMTFFFCLKFWCCLWWWIIIIIIGKVAENISSQVLGNILYMYHSSCTASGYRIVHRQEQDCLALSSQPPANHHLLLGKIMESTNNHIFMWESKIY